MEVIYSSDIDTDAYYEPLDLSKKVRDINVTLLHRGVQSIQNRLHFCQP